MKLFEAVAQDINVWKPLIYTPLERNTGHSFPFSTKGYKRV
jgi:hypothetical protein